MTQEKNIVELEEMITLAGGRITCARCQAMSKRTKKQCRSPAMRGKRVCDIHGGKSTGPVTQAGRKRCASAKTVHGRETRDIRRKRSHGLARLREIEWELFEKGLMSGKRTPGPKPKALT